MSLIAAGTFKLRALVLRKTKLSEKDLVVTLLSEDGSLVRAVAKGARRPGSSYAARMELFTCVDLMLAHGRSLDVVCDARMACPLEDRPEGLVRTSCAATLAELLCHVAQPNLPQARIFALATAAFAAIAGSNDTTSVPLALASASLWKAMAQVGFRPSFSSCVMCGKPLEDNELPSRIAVSVENGGVVCDSCPRPADALLTETDIVRWCQAFIKLRFNDIAVLDISESDVLSTLELAKLWVAGHTGKQLKSIDFLFTAAFV